MTVVPVLTTRSAPAADRHAAVPGGRLGRAAADADLVTALAEGVVEQLLVVEGQEVKAGEPVARLSAADAQLALEAAEAEVLLREGELAAAQGARSAAKDAARAPVPPAGRAGRGRGRPGQAETEQANLPNLRRAADAKRGRPARRSTGCGRPAAR